MSRHLAPIDPSESSTHYECRVPDTVRRGQAFIIQLPNGNKLQAICPQSHGPGDTFRIMPFEVYIPNGMSASRIFTALVNGTPIPVRAPPNKRVGDRLLIHAPVFDHRQQPAGRQQQHQNQNQKPSSAPWGKDRWTQYLTKLAEETPGLPSDLFERTVDIDPALIPDEFVCPITNDLCMDPVVAVDGHTYERSAIEEWLKTHNTSPKTNEKLPNTQILIPNRAIRSQIVEFLKSYQKPTEAVPTAPVLNRSSASQASELRR
eukprot:c32644_g1_i1.p1 GENE.c32644_g1_i1~~c32644_g1_i1.p1  ORF type:complete len:273 (-),score=47.72 c32644_g1_i1:89-871(-)